MNILDSFFSLFKKTEKSRLCMYCKQLVPNRLYKVKYKCHEIGYVGKKGGEVMKLHCNGLELKNE